MRRKDREITDFTEIQQIVTDCEVLRIAIQTEEYPYIVPVNFGFEWEGTDLILYIHGARQGTKLSLLDRNNKVGIEMDTDHETVIDDAKEETSYSYVYRSIVGHGDAELVTELTAKRHALTKIVEHYVAADHVIDISDRAVAGTSVVAIRVKVYTGKQRPKHS